MKTIVNKKRLVLLLGFMAVSMTMWSQIPNIEKMSISTQMFLDELSSKGSFDSPETPPLRESDGSIVGPEIRVHGRHIARPDTIDGKVYVSAFIRVSSEDDINLLKSMGVEIGSRFEKGLLITSLIPVDKIEDVAAIDGVKNIEVAIIMEADTDNARQTTNVDDVLTLSNDALTAGLDHKYDGSGVILGIIDTGIDFQHKAFQDKNGNTRIKGLYCYSGSSVVADWTGSGTLPTTDKTSGDHGSHTSSIAGGSSVIINGTNVTVTDDPSEATYGGMAPNADLYLAGVGTLYTTRIVEAFQRMANYADAQNKPLVVSNSYGSTSGPHDGGNSSGYASAVNEIFGNDSPNRIALFSSGNEAGDADPVQGGGKHVYGTASSSNPLRTILRSHRYSNRDHGYCYSDDLASIWCRSTSVTSMGCRILVLDTRTGEVLKTVTANPSSDGTEVSGLSAYYSGTMKAYTSRSYSKVQIVLKAEDEMRSTSYDSSDPDYYISDYTLALEVYPSSGSAVIDAWGQDYCYFSDYLTTSGYNWTDGTDDMTANDFANNPNIICVGSYVSRERSSGNSLGDISKFSSYATAEANPMGKQLPWITAPGEVLISASNHYYAASSSNIVVNNSTYPYVTKSGTSMACPTAAGIVALWFQAAKEIGKNLTLSEVKEIMKETAIRDSWVTSGANASHFGNGKIDALAGIKYILDKYGNLETHTVCDGDVTTNQFLPVYGYWFDAAQHNQMLYPVSKFTNSSMSGKKLVSMTFYPTSGTYNGTTFTGINFYKDSNPGTVTFRIANMPANSDDFSSGATLKENVDFTLVKSFTMPSSAQTGLTEWVIEFGDDFVYTGGDLLIDVVTEKGKYGRTFFKAENQNGTPGMYSYNTTQQTVNYLPMVTFAWEKASEPPVTAGTVSPDELSFGDVGIGKQSTMTVTITNTGNQTFIPVIDTTNLPSAFSVSGNGAVLPDGTINLTVTYTPTIEGQQSGSFTITIGDQTYTVTVTGSGFVINSTLTSNTEVVIVFKSEAQAVDAIAYQISDIDGDTKHLLPTDNEDGDVNIQVLGNSDITRYDLNRQNGGTNWNVVAVANHDGNDYTQQGYSDNTATVADGATEWMSLIDDAGISSAEATYVPVTHANGLISEDNTYGAARQTKTVTDMSAVVQSIVMSSAYAGGQPWTENGKVYTHYTILLDIDQLIIPTSDTDPTKDYDLYKVRAWRKVDPSLLNERYYSASTGNSGKNRQERLTEDGEFLFEELGYDEYSLVSVTNRDNKYYLGDNSNLTSFYPNWTSRGTNEVMATFGAQKLRENEDETGVIEELSMVFTVRAYYTRTANLQTSGGTKGTRDGESAADGKYYILEYELPLTLHAYDDEIVTAVGSIFIDRQVVDVTYVNSLGMQSSEPFDGMNIVVTRYNDGSVTTTKVIK